MRNNFSEVESWLGDVILNQSEQDRIRKIIDTVDVDVQHLINVTETFRSDNKPRGRTFEYNEIVFGHEYALSKLTSNEVSEKKCKLKFKNFVNSSKSTTIFKTYLSNNFDEMYAWWFKYFPFKPSELTRTRRMIEYVETPKVSKIVNATKRFRSENPPKNESREYYKVLFNAKYADEMEHKKSDRLLGERNPGYNHQGKLSKWSKNYLVSRSDDEYERDLSDLKKKVSNTKKDHPENVNTRIEYYLGKGLNKKDAVVALMKRQSTFSLRSCYERYGKIEGKKVWQARQAKWLQKMIERGYGVANEGTITMEDEIFAELSNNNPDINRQLILPFKNGTKFKFYDFSYNNNIIEFNGDFWHANPLKYQPNDVIGRGRSKRTAKKQWEIDRLKTENAISQGYKILTIWEYDYNQDKEGTINKMLNFLEQS